MRLVKTVVAMAILFCFGYAGYRVYNHFNRPAPKPILAREEVTITIIPGWDLRQVAEYLALKGFASTTADVFALTGVPTKDYRSSHGTVEDSTMLSTDLVVAKAKPTYVSFEGYLAPETYRVYKDASLNDVLNKLLSQRDKQITTDMYAAAQGVKRSMHEVITMASILEEEAKTIEDKKIVADILWRRAKQGAALQVDSSVHYVVDSSGTVFTTDKQRSVDSLWNTYKYPGLPPGPICNPSLESIEAALTPTPNNYWYFLSGRDGVMHYAKTLDEHAANKKYL